MLAIVCKLELPIEILKLRTFKLRTFKIDLAMVNSSTFKIFLGLRKENHDSNTMLEDFVIWKHLNLNMKL